MARCNVVFELPIEAGAEPYLDARPAGFSSWDEFWLMYFELGKWARVREATERMSATIPPPPPPAAAPGPEG